MLTTVSIPAIFDPTVAPVVAVPQSPSYPSEHPAAAGAAAAVLAYLFPDQAANVTDLANQAATSRVMAGVAFPSDVFSGLDMGQSVGQAVVELWPSQADSTVTPVFAIPQDPGFPSGHACASGPSAAVMSVLFPDGAQFFATTANAAGTSTFDAGIHTQYDVSQGLALGGQVGEEVAARTSQDGANQEAVDFVKGPPEGRGADDRFLSSAHPPKRRPQKTMACATVDNPADYVTGRRRIP